jgi:hypothetical protein
MVDGAGRAGKRHPPYIRFPTDFSQQQEGKPQ